MAILDYSKHKINYLSQEVKSMFKDIKQLIKAWLYPKTPTMFFNVGFHGDQYLLDLIDYIFKNKAASYFIETGTYVGSTLAYVARTYPAITCLSCEPDRASFREAQKNCKGLANVAIFNERSDRFVHRISKVNIIDTCNLFWLDAHGQGFEWPLRDEISFVTGNFRQAYIIIDDFKVPGLDCFNFDSYDEQICSFEHIRESIKSMDYGLYYP